MELWDGEDDDGVELDSARAVDPTRSSIDEAIDDEFCNQCQLNLRWSMYLHVVRAVDAHGGSAAVVSGFWRFTCGALVEL